MRLASIVLLSILCTAPAAVAADVEANKQLYRNCIEELINRRHVEAADKCFTVDFIEHNPNLVSGLAGRKQFLAAIHAGFSDYHAEIDQMVAEGDRLAVRIVWTGT